MSLSREELLAKATRRYIEVDGVRIQSLTELERTGLQGLWAKRYEENKDADPETIMGVVHRNKCETLAWSLVDASGKQLFEHNDKDMEVIGSLPPDLFDALYKAAAKHTGLADDDEEEIEGNVKKSSETPDSN